MSKTSPSNVCGRFAPSPTGRIHLGNIYSMLIAWLSARHAQGKVLMRIEDLDPRAHNPYWTQQLLRDVQALGLYWDGDVVYQHMRLELYAQAIKRLQEMGLLYPCFCTRAELHAASAPHVTDGTPIYPGTCKHLSKEAIKKKSAVRAPALRLCVPPISYETPTSLFSKDTCSQQERIKQINLDATIEFEDRTYGLYKENLSKTCGDFLVQRSDSVYAYQLAVVVDDALMKVNEIVRGSDLLKSTPRQIYLQHLLDFKTPVYAHIPLLVASDGHRLSKRNQDCNFEELLKIFGSPQALLGKLAFVTGLSNSDSPTTPERLVDKFSWDKIRMHPQNFIIDNHFFD